MGRAGGEGSVGAHLRIFQGENHPAFMAKFDSSFVRIIKADFIDYEYVETADFYSNR